MSKELYYDKTEIGLDKPSPVEICQRWSDRILKHELAGLKLLGCDIHYDDNGLISTLHSSQSFFLNRTLGVTKGNLDSLELKSLPRSVVVPSFTPDATQIELSLIGREWQHSLSSIIMVSDIERKPYPDTQYTIQDVDQNAHFEEAFAIFASFFIKADETTEQAQERFRHNTQHGPHKVIFDGNMPVAMVGSIVAGDIATLYSGIIEEKHRGSNILPLISAAMSEALLDQRVASIYMKTRNKAVALYGQRFHKFVHLYNERVYEKEG